MTFFNEGPFFKRYSGLVVFVCTNVWYLLNSFTFVVFGVCVFVCHRTGIFS